MSRPLVFPQSSSCYIYPHEEDPCCSSLGPRVRRPGLRCDDAPPPSPSSPPPQSLARLRPSIHGGRWLRENLERLAQLRCGPIRSLQARLASPDLPSAFHPGYRIPPNVSQGPSLPDRPRL